jgi:dihydrofolate reductase|tara:strand:- start:238 stop:774 length:537 start_codon:yes stop_codon:yes gene_type:complete
MKKEVILYIAISEDGFIAGAGENLDFLNMVQVEGEDYGYAQFLNSIDVVLVGRKTYEKVISMGYPYHDDKKVFVITKSQKTSNKENFHYYTGNLVELIHELKTATQKNIYCDGGAELVTYLIKRNLIDQIILSVIPLKLKRGTLLFKQDEIPQSFKWVNSVEFKSGLIQKTFLRKEEQ